MATPLDYLLQGEYLKGIIEPFSRVTGLSFFLFVILTAIMVIAYAQTGSIAVPLILFFVISGSLMYSHLADFSVPTYIIPEPFQTFAYILVIGALAAVLIAVFTKK